MCLLFIADGAINKSRKEEIMKNITTILEEAKVELTDEQKQAIENAVGENYRTIADYQKQQKKVESTEAQLKSAQETIERFSGIGRRSSCYDLIQK